MKVIKEKIGGADVYIQTLDDSLMVVGSEEGVGRATRPTGIEDDLREGYHKIRSLVRNIAADMGTELMDLASKTRPDKIGVEFSLGISAEGKVVWLVTGKGEFGMKVTMNWEFGSDENHTQGNG